MTSSTEAQLKTLKSHEIQNPLPIPAIFSPLTIRNGLLSNSGCQTRKKRPNRSTNNGGIVENAKHEVSE